MTVTGSNVRRTDSETPSPLQVITAQELKSSGYTSVQEVLHNITANGQGTLSQSFSGAFAAGAAGISLRGLGVGATLVLIDGHRMAPYPLGDDNQRSFVDIANIPFDAIDRIEVLKDGASAIYGSDAIAGVVNIILKRSFVGTTITADVGTSYRNDGSTHRVSGMVGFGDLGSDGRNFYVSAELRKQNQIRLIDRGGSFTQTDFTANGGYDLTPGVPAPGNPLVGSHPASATGYVTDASGTIVGFMPGCDAARLAARRCTFNDTWSQIQPATENRNLLGRYTQNLGANWQLSLQSSYFESKAQTVIRPSRDFANGFQGITSGPGVIPTLLPTLDPTTIPSTNPSFPGGTGLAAGVLHYNFLDVGPRINDTEARSTRLVASVEGRLDAWDLAASAGFTQVLLDITGRNAVDPFNLQAAMNSTTDPYLVGRSNSPGVIAFIAPTLKAHDTSTLKFIHLAAARDVIALPGGPAALALGVDLVRRTQNARQPAAAEAGRVPYGNAFTVGRQDVNSVYGEVVAPVTRLLEVDAAVRYDHYNLSGGKASPKFGVKYKPVPELALRATASHGFRAPGPAENGTAGAVGYGAITSDPVLCPDPAHPGSPGSFPSQCALSLAGLFGSNPALKPETSKGYTLGLIVEPVRGVSATLDFYSIHISNQVGFASSATPVRGTNFTPIEQVQPDGSTALVMPPVAPIAYERGEYTNANSTKTTGVDFSLQFRGRIEGVGTYSSDLTVSYTAKYDLTIDGFTYHLAGTHAPYFASGNTGSPRARAQWINTFTRGPWQITGTVNYISSFGVTDPSVGFATCLDALSGGAAGLAYQGVLAAGAIPNGVSCKVGSFTTLDVYARYDISKQFSIHASVINLFNTSAPKDWATYGGALGNVPWNPSFHNQGAIGRYFSIGATYAF